MGLGGTGIDESHPIRYEHLTLFTIIQLTPLARSKYFHSVNQQERDERLRERFEFRASAALIFLGEAGEFLDLENLIGDDEEKEDEISEHMEFKYLTLSGY
jgi:peroxin-3